MQYRQITHHGPQILDDGRICFRLWAPSADKIDLLLDGGAPLPMRNCDNGWFMLEDEQAKIGSRYQFKVNDEQVVPDPASRWQAGDIDEPSVVIDPHSFDWPDDNWQGRPWQETVLYELHLGTFSENGTYQGLIDKLDHLVSLGITAIEIMPIAQFPGAHSWGYDGVLLYAPDSTYGSPEDLKRMVAACHVRSIQVILDVVYNHFGPAGNYLHAYADKFFTEAHHTPWGAAINFEDEHSLPVRQFYIENALMWLNEYRFDGLRFDAVHEIKDDSEKHFLHELAETIRAAMPPERHVHLILENEKNQAHQLDRDMAQQPKHFTAQWNDDVHHILHVLCTGETAFYYQDYASQPLNRLGRALTQGFDYQGEASERRKNKLRGEPSGHLPPEAFIDFMQNHDQVGNRAFGERVSHLHEEHKITLGYAVIFLSPHIPMLFMGEEWWASTPFQFFVDFDEDLGKLVRAGRQKEFSDFPEFSEAGTLEKIPGPNSAETFNRSKLKWDEINTEPHHKHLAFTQKLLALRHEHVVPLLKSGWQSASYEIVNGALHSRWQFKAGLLQLWANFSDTEITGLNHIGETHIWGNFSDTLPPWKCAFSVTGNSHE